MFVNVNSAEIDTDLVNRCVYRQPRLLPNLIQLEVHNKIEAGYSTPPRRKQIILGKHQFSPRLYPVSPTKYPRYALFGSKASSTYANRLIEPT